MSDKVWNNPVCCFVTFFVHLSTRQTHLDCRFYVRSENDCGQWDKHRFWTQGIFRTTSANIFLNGEWSPPACNICAVSRDHPLFGWNIARISKAALHRLLSVNWLHVIHMSYMSILSCPLCPVKMCALCHVYRFEFLIMNIPGGLDEFLEVMVMSLEVIQQVVSIELLG